MQFQLVSCHAPLDPFSFIPSTNDFLSLPCLDEVILKKPSPDSGVDSSSPSHPSPENRKDEIYDMYGRSKKQREDDEDSGFRSRVNSG